MHGYYYTDEEISDLNIDSDMLGANENYFVSTYISDFNSLEMISASDVNARMNKSAFADVGDFPFMVPLCNRNSSAREIYKTIRQKTTKSCRAVIFI